MSYFIIGIYLLGCIVSYRMFMRQEDPLIDGWGLVFLGLYFSLSSWITVLIYFLFECESEPPGWLTLKKKKNE